MKNKLLQIISIAFLFVMCFGFCAFAEYDIGFETGEVTCANSVYSYDNILFGNTAANQLELVNSEVYSGTRSMLFTATRYSSPYFKLSLKTNTMYKVSAYVKVHPDMTRALLNLVAPKDSGIYTPTSDFRSCYELYRYSSGHDEEFSRNEWTELIRYIYIPSDTETEKNVELGISSTNCDIKCYVDDVTVSEIDNIYSLTFDYGDEVINSSETGVYYYGATLKTKGFMLNKQNISYSLSNAIDGVSLDESTGQLTVDQGTEGEVKIKVTATAPLFGNTVFDAEKTIVIENKAVPDVESITLNGNEILNFSEEVYDYYDIPYVQTPEVKAVSDYTYTTEIFDGKIRIIVENDDYINAYNLYMQEEKTQFPPKLIYDGGFEDGVLTELSGTGAAKISQLSHSGDYSSELTLIKHQGKYFTIKAQPGKVYIASMWVKLKEDSVVDNAFMYIDGAKVYNSDFRSVYSGGAFNDDNYLKVANLSTSEWIQITKVFYTDEEKNVDIGLLHYKDGVLRCLVDDVYIGEFADGEALEKAIIENRSIFGVTKIQNKEKQELLISTLIGGKMTDEEPTLIVAEYDSAGKMLKVSLLPYKDIGAYIERISVSSDEIKLFLWNSMKPMTPFERLGG